MKEAEYFQQAQEDADYRRAKIAELREQRKNLGGLLIFFGGLMIAFWVYLFIAERDWLNSIGSMLGSITLMAWVYTNTGTRLAALEAMDGKTPKPAAPPLEHTAS